jgi:ABC-type transporter Mla MlaB component
MSEIKTPRPRDSAPIRLSGALNLNTIAPTHKILSEALQGCSRVAVELESGDDIDLTLVQLLIAARRTAEAEEGSFALTRPADGALLQMLRRGGFVETAQQRAFWLHSVEEPA